MDKGSLEAVKRISHITVYAAILVALALPSTYFGLAYQFMAGTLKAEAGISGHLSSMIISGNPSMWYFQTSRLEEITERDPEDSEKYHRQIFDTKNKVIVDNGVELAHPLMTKTETLFDSGVPVGQIKVSLSLRPILANTGWMALSGILLGGLIFFAFRDLPLRTLRQAWGDLAHSKEIAEITAQIARAVGSTLETEEIFKTIAQMIRSAIPFDRFMIASYSVEKEKYLFYYADSENSPDYTDPNNISGGPSDISKLMAKEMYTTKKLQNTPDIQDSPWSNSRHAKAGFRAMLAIPILQDNECIAHLRLASREVGAFSKKHENLLTSIASHLGPAIRNASLLRESEERAQRLAILNELSRKISQNMKLEETLTRIARASVELTQGDKSRIFLFDERTETFNLCASEGEIADGGAISFHLGQGLVGTVAQTGEALVIPDIQKDPRWVNIEWARRHDLHAYIATPVYRQGKPFVVINCFSQEINFFDKEDLELLTALASQIATVIEKARLMEETRDHAARQEITAKIARAVGSTLESDELFQTIVKEIRRAVPVDRILIARLISEEGNYNYYFDDASEHSGPSSKNVPSTGLISSIVYQTKRPHLIPDLSAPSWRETHHAKLGYRSALVIPILQDDQCIAHMHLSSKKPAFFTTAHEELLTSIASHLGAAIQNTRLHDEARRSRNFFRSVIADNADAIMVVDVDRKIIQWNIGAEKLLGYSEEEALGKSVQMLIPEKNRDAAHANGTRAFQEGESSHFEAERLHKDGTPMLVSITISPVKDESGNTIAMCIIYKDLIERIESEKKLKLALEEAEAGSRAKSEFLSTMSHELRSPLNSVIGFSDLIMRDAESKDEMTLQLVPKIRESGKYLLAMIEEILDLDRIEAGKTVLNVEQVAINDLTGAVVDSWHARLPGNFSLSLECDPDCGIVPCDSRRVGQILNNLIDNAIKYSPEGGAICVRTRAGSDETRISVRDEGMGIKPEEKETIFDRFHQLESGYTRRAGGLGIGLALAHKLIEMHGGRIWVESEEGKGSMFTIALPHAQLKTPQAGIPKINEEEPAGNDAPWSGRKILVVDDMDYYHEYMKILMKSATLVESAFNGEEAIEAVCRIQPDLILMDLRMPVMDGFEAIRRLKTGPATKDIPILAVTAQAMAEDKELAVRAGANGFITKPIEVEVIKSEIARALGARV